MITIKNKAAIQKMEEAGHLLLEIFDQIPALLKPGVSTLELDTWIEEQQKQRNLVSKMKGYRGYRHVSCISVNDEVVHGVPNAQRILADGDLVKIDVCVSFSGYCADMARSYVIGTGSASDQARRLAEVTRQALDKGIEKARPGNRLTDISAAIQAEVERHGFGVVRDFAGHGIGRQMHEDPEILNYGKAGQGPLLQPGMAFALEPMITLGKYDVYITSDGWTVKTVDKFLSTLNSIAL